MAAIAALLPLARAEGRGDVVDVAEHDVEQLSPAGRLEIGDRALQHVAGAIELVVVAEVGPALVDLAADIPAVQIAVGKLRLGELLGDRIDLRLDRRVAPMLQRVARRLDPFADVGVPENLGGEIVVLVARDAERRRRLRHIERSEDAVLDEPHVLARDGAGQHGVEPLAPEVALDGDIGEVDRSESTHLCFSFSPRRAVDQSLPLRDRRRTTRVRRGCRAAGERPSASRRRSGRSDSGPPRGRAPSGSCRRS